MSIEALISSGRIVDVIIVFMMVEAAALLLLRRPLALDMNTLDVVSLMLPGLFLLLALRGALMSSSWQWIAVSLLCALAAHVADLWRRNRRA